MMSQIDSTLSMLALATKCVSQSDAYETKDENNYTYMQNRYFWSAVLVVEDTQRT
jgi:hypothetical protein